MALKNKKIKSLIGHYPRPRVREGSKYMHLVCTNSDIKWYFLYFNINTLNRRPNLF